MPDIVIVGGGIIGLTVAWNLVQEGVSVTVLERGQTGEGASGAAAGMLAPLAEAPRRGPFTELGLASLRLYPEFIQALRDEAGLNAELETPGLLRVANTPEAAESLCAAAEWQRRAGQRVECLDGDAARDLEPELSSAVVAAVHSPDETQFDPRLLVRSLAIGCARRGVEIRECTPVTGFTCTSNRIHAVETPAGPVPCDIVVVAGGAWSDQIGSWLESRLPVFPVKGQIMALRCVPPPIRYTVYAHHGYLVPRTDGRVIVGATAESAGFDTRPTVAGMSSLLQTAVNLVPSLADAPFDSVWAGLRPATQDGLPILGRLPRWENGFAATGHFRNGILLAPVTGELLTGAIVRGETPPLLQPLLPDRFAA